MPRLRKASVADIEGRTNLEILSNEDGISSDESQLGDRNGKQDRITHPGTVQCPTNVYPARECLQPIIAND